MSIEISELESEESFGMWSRWMIKLSAIWNIIRVKQFVCLTSNLWPSVDPEDVRINLSYHGWKQGKWINVMLLMDERLKADSATESMLKDVLK